MMTHQKQTVEPQRQRSFLGSAGLATASLLHLPRRDRAVRRTVCALLALLPVVVLLPVSRIEHLILVLSMMLVVLAETVNSAIEATVDRISSDIHPLSKTAKDTAAAAVVVAVLMACLSWTVIAGPVLWAVAFSR